MLTDQLVAYIFGDSRHLLVGPFGQWVEDSSRFKAFAETYRDKIRKKVRLIQEDESRSDLLAELETAYLLLQDRRCTVEYEKYGIGQQRGPDFAVTFRTRTIFNVEVKRLRPARLEAGIEAQNDPTRMINAICDKLGQMPAGMINVLVLVTEDEGYDGAGVSSMMKSLKLRAEQRDDAFFVRRRFTSYRDFLQQYLQLSGLLLRSGWQAGTGSPPALWLNPEARRPIPPEIALMLLTITGG
jgi:hypothetical protein